MTAVHEVLATLGYGDAIGHEVDPQNLDSSDWQRHPKEEREDHREHLAHARAE